MVGAGAVHDLVARRGQAPGLGPLLQLGLRIGRTVRGHLPERPLPRCARRPPPSSPGPRRGRAPPAAPRRRRRGWWGSRARRACSLRRPSEGRRHAEASGDHGAGVAADQGVHPLGQLPFARIGVQQHQALGGQEVQHPVAQEFELFIVGDLARAFAGAGVGEGPVQEFAILEGVAEPELQLRQGALALVAGRALAANGHFRMWKNRLGRASRIQVQGLKDRAPWVPGQQDDLRPADQVLRRHVADPDGLGIAAVLGVVAVVAHHEVVLGRHDIDAGVVHVAARPEVRDGVACGRSAGSRGSAPPHGRSRRGSSR